jgi:nucleoside-diphosphate-sugar epimerase
MKVFILGASGFLAGEVIRQLKALEGVEIVAGVRDPAKRNFGPGVEVRKVEATDAASIAAAMDGVTHAIDCVMGTPEAMKAAAAGMMGAGARFGVTRQVHLSSIAVFGDASGRVDEDHAFGNGGDWYSAAKIECEELIRRSPVAASVVTLRPALIYGPGSALWSVRIAQLLKAHRLGDLGEAGDGLANLIHVRDVAQAVIAGLTVADVGGRAFNLSDPTPPTWNEYLMHFARALGATPVRRIPPWQMKLERKALAPALKIMEIASSKLKVGIKPPPPITPGLARLFDQIVSYDSGRADVLFPAGRIPWRQGVEEVAATLRG